MPSPVVAREGVEFVNDQRSDATEKTAVIDFGGDHHGLQRLRCRQEDLRGITLHLAARRIPDITVPEADPETDERSVTLKPWLDVVEQSFEWTDVEHRQATPALGRYAREEGKKCCFRLASGCRREK